MNKFFDLGYDQYKEAPDLMLIEVWRRAFTTIGADMRDDKYPGSLSYLPYQDFVYGYIAARKHRENK